MRYLCVSILNINMHTQYLSTPTFLHVYWCEHVYWCDHGYRSIVHRIYRFFKFITISMSVLLFIAQVVSVIFLPFDGVELALKLFLSSFSVLIILNEAEWWSMLEKSPLFKQWVPRGVSQLSFIGTYPFTILNKNCH